MEKQIEIGSIIVTASGKRLGVNNVFPTKIPGATCRIESHERKDYLMYGASLKEIACSDIELVIDVLEPADHLGY